MAMQPDDEGRVSLSFRNLSELPPKVFSKADSITSLDLTENQFSDAQWLHRFVNLRVLILDSNKITSKTAFSLVPSLETLWVNKNKIDNLPAFLNNVSKYFPSLKYLSMLNNPACPNFFNQGTPSQYEDFRLFTVHRLRHLKALNDTLITKEERKKAKTRYG
eukprot:GCRY01002908.1.p1 GENE.GCRY01002908.1~~GCRY01002908.1.p1  ORF type:complete len:162 (-),score=18.88 GCRY01002908.1:296-781(-)